MIMTKTQMLGFWHVIEVITLYSLCSALHMSLDVMYKTILKPVVVYGLETWGMPSNKINK